MGTHGFGALKQCTNNLQTFHLSSSPIRHVIPRGLPRGREHGVHLGAVFRVRSNDKFLLERRGPDGRGTERINKRGWSGKLYKVLR